MKIAGLVDALNILTDIPFTEWAWSEAPEDGYGVVTADGQSELKADADPVAEKMLTGYVDVFIKATDPDPTEDVEDAMRAIGVWFRMESIQFEPETGYLHFEWRYTDTMNNAKKAILNTLPLLLHVTSAEWDEGSLRVTFAETPGEIFEAVGARPVGFYVPIEEEMPGGLIVTTYYYMTLAEYSKTTDEMKAAVFKGFDDGKNKYLEIEVLTEASEYSTDGSFKTASVVFTYDNGVISDPGFTYNNLVSLFEERKPVYIYDDGAAGRSILMLMQIHTRQFGDDTIYEAFFLGANQFSAPMIWGYEATSRNDIMTEI